MLTYLLLFYVKPFVWKMKGARECVSLWVKIFFIALWSRKLNFIKNMVSGQIQDDAVWNLKYFFFVRYNLPKWSAIFSVVNVVILWYTICRRSSRKDLCQKMFILNGYFCWGGILFPYRCSKYWFVRVFCGSKNLKPCIFLKNE